jgi:hypothetical protein
VGNMTSRLTVTMKTCKLKDTLRTGGNRKKGWLTGGWISRDPVGDLPDDWYPPVNG